MDGQIIGISTLQIVEVHALMPKLMSGLTDDTGLCLQNMVKKWKHQSGTAVGNGVNIGGAESTSTEQHMQDEDNWGKIMLMEEMEQFALEDMKKMLALDYSNILMT